MPLSISSASTASSNDSVQHPYLTSHRLSNIESWQQSISAQQASRRSMPRETPRYTAAMDPNIQAYLDMKAALYSRQLKS